MKKIIAILLSMLSALLLGCTPKAAAEPMRIGGLKGPTSMGMIALISEPGDKYSFTIAGTADEITPKLIAGELDLAAIPANLASVLYNKTEGKIVTLAVNTLGVLYILDTDGSIQSATDLKGKTIYATGKGAVPEYTLRHVLTQNGIDPDSDVDIQWKSEPAEVVSMLASGGVAMLPQPYVMTALANAEGLRIALDFTEEWEKTGSGMLVTGVLVGRKEYVDSHKSEITTMLKEYKASVKIVNSNPSAAAKLMEEAGIVKATVGEKAIPYCNIVFRVGDEMKADLGGYLEALYAIEPKAVGGSLPDDGFYY